jgi:DNA-binding beta-propeller fold protein YncE
VRPPAAVAVDEPTGRVFVAEAGANSVRVFDAFWTLAHAAIDD